MKLRKILKAAAYLLIVFALGSIAWNFKNFISIFTNNDPRIIHIIDGDSLLILENNIVKEIRLIGYDAPELKTANTAKECFANRSIHALQAAIEDQKIKVTADPETGDTDKYGRYLRYITLQDGSDLSQKLLRQGAGHQMTVQPYSKQDDYIQSQKEAEVDQQGLWSESNCPQISPISG